MKRTNTIYWIFTMLLALGMLASAIPSILSIPQATAGMAKLGYPPYFGPFLGVAKLLGVIAILVPGFPKIREWAYAGFAFDLISATYSQLLTGTPISRVSMMLIWFVVFIGSYVYYHKKLRQYHTKTLQDA